MNDLQLFIGCVCRPTGSCRLNCQMQGKRAELAQPHVDPGSVLQETKDRHRTSRPDCTMKRSGPALIRMIDVRSMLNQKIDERCLCFRIPGPAGVGSRVAGLM